MPDDPLSEHEMRRLDKAHNLDVTPRDLLRSIIADIDAGRIKPDGIVVVAVQRPLAADKLRDWEIDYYRAGMTRDAEVVLYDMAHDHARRRWRGA